MSSCKICIFLSLVCFFVCPGSSSEKKSENSSTLSSQGKKPYFCCARQANYISVGYGTTGKSIQVDVGHCKRFCPRYLYDDPGDLSKPAVQKCTLNSVCRAKTSNLERVSTIKGVKVIEVIDSCDCFSTSTYCRRDKYFQNLHVGTPYQTQIDVGVCIGSCKRYNCRPSRNSTKSIQGPNGKELYQAIERCSCAPDCHRLDHFETILDFSRLEVKKGMKLMDVRPVVKQVNVGQCAGSCVSNATETCLLRDKKNPRMCLTGLLMDRHDCTPIKFKIHEYRTRRGMRRELIQITQCACV